MLNSFIPHKMELSESSNPSNTREKPSSVLIYNKKMNGVDYVDQQLAPYESLRKTVKWYKKLAFHIFDLCIYNSHILYNNMHNEKNISYKEFLMNMIKELIECPDRTQAPKSTEPEHGHYPEK